jgi:phosphoribosylformylglycinamidine synthase
MASPPPKWELPLKELNLGNHGATVAPLQADEPLDAWISGLPRFNKPPPAQVPLYQARVLVSLRPSVLDPAGEATRAAAARLGVSGVCRLRIGKAVEVELEAPDRATAQAQLEQLSDRLLANPVIENWQLEIVESAEVQQA